MASILVIDDEPAICRLLKGVFSDLGHHCETSGNIEQGLALAGFQPWDVVFVDVRLPDGNGLDILPDLHKSLGEPESIIMTGYSDPDGAELAITNGAWDYLQKPPSVEQFTLTLDRALKYRKQKQAHPARIVLDHEDIVGESPAIKKCLHQVADAAPTDASVLISGATGTGKELFANIVHRNSSRSKAPFVIVDCASLPDTLVESVLFGHEKGAFTGADKATKGLIQHAHRGTLFLDEVGELPLALQKTFLRVLQERCYRPVGSPREVTSDFRLVAATNRDLNRCVEEGTFRQDLLYRLKTYHIQLPTLAERVQDIKEITVHYLHQLCRKYNIPPKGISQDFFQTLTAYTWPGNVRELVNTLERVLTEAIDAPDLFAKHLPVEIRAKSIRMAIDPAVNNEIPEPGESGEQGPLPYFREFRAHAIDRMERRYLQKLIAESQADLKRAMAISNLGKTRLYSLLNKHGLSLKA